MKSRIHTQNFYKVSLESLIGIDSSSDNTEKSFVVSGQLSGAPTYLIIDASDISKRDIIYVHKISGNTCYYYPYNRSNPNVEHETGTYVYMNDVAEFFNYLGKNTDDFGLITKKTGLDITVYGGNIKVNGQDIQVVDTNLTVADNTTNYIVFDYIDNSIKTLTNTSGLTGIVLGEVITSGGVVDSIIDKRGYTAPIFFDGNVFEVIDGKVKIKNGVITPAAHTHTASDITNFNSAVANNSVVSANTNARHTHSNKSALDNITNTGSGDKFLADDGTYKPTNNVHNLNDLSDVNTSGASGGQVLGYDDTNSVWKPVDQTGGSGNDLNTRKYLWFTVWQTKSSGSQIINNQIQSPSHVYDAIVASDGSGDYISLSAAIDDGKKNIFVKSGIYNEVLNNKLIDYYIKITGENRDTTIIKFNTADGGGYFLYMDGGGEVGNLTINLTDGGSAASFIFSGRSDTLVYNIYYKYDLTNQGNYQGTGGRCKNYNCVFQVVGGLGGTQFMTINEYGIYENCLFLSTQISFKGKLINCSMERSSDDGGFIRFDGSSLINCNFYNFDAFKKKLYNGTNHYINDMKGTNLYLIGIPDGQYLYLSGEVIGNDIHQYTESNYNGIISTDGSRIILNGNKISTDNSTFNIKDYSTVFTGNHLSSNTLNINGSNCVVVGNRLAVSTTNDNGNGNVIANNV